MVAVCVVELHAVNLIRTEDVAGVHSLGFRSADGHEVLGFRNRRSGQLDRNDLAQLVGSSGKMREGISSRLVSARRVIQIDRRDEARLTRVEHTVVVEIQKHGHSGQAPLAGITDAVVVRIGIDRAANRRIRTLLIAEVVATDRHAIEHVNRVLAARRCRLDEVGIRHFDDLASAMRHASQ